MKHVGRCEVANEVEKSMKRIWRLRPSSGRTTMLENLGRQTASAAWVLLHDQAARRPLVRYAGQAVRQYTPE